MNILHNVKMKLGATIACGILAAGICLPATANFIPKASAETYSSPGIGYATNIITQDLGEPLTGSPVLDPDYLKGSEIPLVEVTLNSVKKDSTSNISYKKLTSEIRQNTKAAVQGGLSYNAFTCNAYTKFDTAIQEAKSTITSQYYTIWTEEKQLYSLSLENGAYFSEAYQDHYNPLFLNNLSQLKTSSSYSDYEDFFELYGTHVIVGGIYGAKASGFYGIYSTTEGFTASTQDAFETGIKAAFNKNIQVGSDMSYTFDTINGISSEDVTIINSFSAKGGNVNAKNNLEDGKGYASWTSKVIKENAALINYPKNGLLPIWEALPSEYSNLASTFEKYFKQYARNAQNSELDGLKEEELLEKDEYSTAMVNVRAEEKTITDSERWKNHYDTIEIPNTFGFHVNTLKTYGFNNVVINIKFQAKRVHDAQRRLVFIYQNENKSEENNIKLLETSFSEISKTYAWKNFSTEKKAIDLLAHDKFVVRYRATGAWSDDWKNKDLSAQLVFYK